MSLEKFLGRTKSVGDCLEWTGCLNTDGYPRANLKGNSNVKVHREVFFLVNGFYPPVVRHKCDNPVCINPDHLEAGTNIDNIKDRVERGRTHNHIRPEIKEKVFSLRSQGLAYKEIANMLGINWKQVDTILYINRKKGGVSCVA